MNNAQTIAAREEQESGSSETYSEKYKRGTHPNSLKNLVPWTTETAPRDGRKRDVAQEIAKRIFEQNAEAVYQSLGDALLKGNAYAFSVLADRGYGKVKERLELTGADGGPISYSQSRLAALSTEELAALESIARKLAAPVGDSSGDSAASAEQNP